MNGGPLPVHHGSPLRLRAERHIGYENARFVGALEAVQQLDGSGRGEVSYWADRGIQWYVGMQGRAWSPAVPAPLMTGHHEP